MQSLMGMEGWTTSSWRTILSIQITRFEHKHIYEKKKNASGFEYYVLSSYIWKVLLSHLNISTLYFIDEMYRWLGEVWTTAGSKDFCTCPCTYATVTKSKHLVSKTHFLFSLTTKSVCILDICWSLNILGLHLHLQSVSFPQTYCDKYSLSSRSLYWHWFCYFFFLCQVLDYVLSSPLSWSPAGFSGWHIS